MAVYQQVGEYKVRTDQAFLNCDCVEWMVKYKIWASRSALVPSAPTCVHIKRVLGMKQDTLPSSEQFVVAYVSIQPDLSLSTRLDEPEGHLVGCSLLRSITNGLFDEEKSVFLGYLPVTSSRHEIRALLLPVLAEYYFENVCPSCHLRGGGFDRQELRDGAKVTAIAYHGGYLMKMGTCHDCNVSDLVPSPSPYPPKVVNTAWTPLTMGKGKKPREKPPAWAPGSVTLPTWSGVITSPPSHTRPLVEGITTVSTSSVGGGTSYVYPGGSGGGGSISGSLHATGTFTINGTEYTGTINIEPGDAADGA